MCAHVQMHMVLFVEKKTLPWVSDSCLLKLFVLGINNSILAFGENV